MRKTHTPFNARHLEKTLSNLESDESNGKAAKTVEEARKLMEAGFEYVCTHENIMLFRKRK